MFRALEYLTFPMVLVLLGGVLSAVGVFIATYRQNQGKTASLAQSAQLILALSGAILSAIGAFIATYTQNQEKNISTAQRAQFEKDLRLKTEEIAELNKSLAATVTGGDSYCWISVTRPLKQTRAGDFILQHHGQYPLYDVIVRIQDLEAYGRATEEEMKTGKEGIFNTPSTMTKIRSFFNQGSKVIELGNIAQGRWHFLGEYKLPSTGQQSYRIEILARNGVVNEDIEFKCVNGEWKTKIAVRFNDKVVQDMNLGLGACESPPVPP